MLVAHQSQPRDWTQAEIDLVEAVCEAAWSTIEDGRRNRSCG